MGNSNQVPINQNSQSLKRNNQNNASKKLNLINEDEIFDKITSISNELLLEYNTFFLDNDFCSKLSFIF